MKNIYSYIRARFCELTGGHNKTYHDKPAYRIVICKRCNNYAIVYAPFISENIKNEAVIEAEKLIKK